MFVTGQIRLKNRERWLFLYPYGQIKLDFVHSAQRRFMSLMGWLASLQSSQVLAWCCTSLWSYSLVTSLKGFSHCRAATILKTTSLLRISSGKPGVFESGFCRYGVGQWWRGRASHMYLYLPPGGCRKKFNMLNSRQQSKICLRSHGRHLLPPRLKLPPLCLPSLIEMTRSRGLLCNGVKSPLLQSWSF